MNYLLFIIAFAPCLIWLRYFYKKDKHEPEPVGYVLMIFFFGCIAVIPAGFVNSHVLTIMKTASLDGFYFAFFSSIFVVGPNEEFWKFLPVYLLLFTTKEFNEPIDGVVYASAAALGFAAVENIQYMEKFGWDVIFLRGLLSNMGHVVFSSIWGLYLGLAKFAPQGKKLGLIVTGLVMAAITHGMYNMVLEINIYPYFAALFVLGLGGAFAITLSSVKNVKDKYYFIHKNIEDVSPFRKKPNANYKCPNSDCNMPFLSGNEECPHCGEWKLFNPDGYLLYCSKCESEITYEDQACGECGLEFI